MSDQVNLKEEWRKITFEALVKEAGEFYSLTIKIATLFLGGVILLIEKIAPHKTTRLMYGAYIFLVIGILLLLATSCLTFLIRKKNIQSAIHALREQYDKSEKIDEVKEGLTNWTVIFLILGMFCITIFGLISFFSKIN